MILFSVRFIMAVIISHSVIQRKSILTRHVIDRPEISCVSLNMKLCSGDHPLVTLEKATHILHKSSVVLCQHILFVRLSGNIRKHFFDSIQKRISLDQLLRDTISYQMETIHMIVFFPEPQCIKGFHRCGICREIHFHNTFYSGLMKGPHHIAELLLRFPSSTVSAFGCKIKSRLISPVIDPALLMLLPDHDLSGFCQRFFHKFITWH